MAKTAARISRKRVDQLLVDRGMADSRSKAQALVMAGAVFHGERRIDKPGATVPDDGALAVRGRDHPWVSRGGLKLAHGIERFGVDPAGRICLDIGASTGGFTDVLLHNGAARVYAVDVGHGQLAWKLRTDPRVIVLEKTNARHLNRDLIPDPPGAIVWRRQLHRPGDRAARRAGACRAGRLVDRPDQAAVPSRAGAGRQGRRGARSGGPRGGVP